MDFAALMIGHDAHTVSGMGWDGLKNGELLRRMAGRFDVLVTMDANLPHQQNLTAQPFGVVLVQAASNRLVHLEPLVPTILAAVGDVGAGELRRVGA
ncbi:hypothetical protein [Aquisalimonas sp.]|uniref:hypothetical protein n=1 Tax=Aquisalimonas sp. TaxID=1872621 RepID=UPI0025BBD4FE|nr:hypothetical protein [Aquisalimonas sp.]